MTIAQVRQWARVVPLSFQEKFEDAVEKLRKKELVKWLLVLTLSKKGKVERAMEHALYFAESGNIYYQYKKCLFGCTKVWVYTERHFQYKLVFWDSIHFQNLLSETPRFRNNGKIKLNFRENPLPFSDPTKTASYLEIEKTI